MPGLTDGRYYRKQLGCQSTIIAWSHRSRFETALRVVGPSVRRLLDYGCGDGTFLAMAAPRVELGVGTDIDAEQLEDCRARFAELENLRFHALDELSDPVHEGRYDVVTCMETLEHCPDAVADIVLADLVRLVAPGGRVLISVPVEVGPTFVIKAAVRKLAALRGLSDYRHYESYSLRDALGMIFAGSEARVPRPLYGDAESPHHSHYGFNWRSMRERVRTRLDVERTLFSPLGWFGGWLSSQAWFVCRPRAGGPPANGRDPRH